MRGCMQSAQRGPWHMLDAKQESNIRSSSSNNNSSSSSYNSYNDIVVRHCKWPAHRPCLDSLPEPHSLQDGPQDPSLLDSCSVWSPLTLNQGWSVTPIEYGGRSPRSPSEGSQPFCREDT